MRIRVKHPLRPGVYLYECTLNGGGVRCLECNETALQDMTFCPQHLAECCSVRIAPSRIPGAGLGLFATDEIDAGQLIGIYVGETLTPAELSARYDYRDERGRLVEQTAPYAMTGRNGVIVDSIEVRNFVAYANDARHSGFSNNAHMRNGLELYAKTDIHAGDEILYAYGPSYWKGRMAQVEEERVHIKSARRVT